MYKRQTDALGRSTYYGYDLLGRAVLKKDRDGYETRYRYTPSGKREEILYGDGRRAQYHYDAAGNLTGVEDWNGTTTFINDALGLSLIHISAGKIKTPSEQE